MTPSGAQKLLYNIFIDEDPLFYMKVHADEITKALKDEDDNVKWNTLKNVIMAMTSRTELVEDHFTGDQRWGFDEALSRVENIIEKMEKEQK